MTTDRPRTNLDFSRRCTMPRNGCLQTIGTLRGKVGYNLLLTDANCTTRWVLLLYFLISWILKAVMPSYLRTTVWTRSTRLTSSHQMMKIHQMDEVLRCFLEQYFLKASLMRTTQPRLLAPLNPSNYLRRLLQLTRQLLVVPSVAVVWILMKTLLR